MCQNKRVNYKNDLAFRCIFGENDKDSEYLRKIAIEGVYGIKYQSLIIENPELNLMNIRDRDMFLDIIAKTVEGEQLNIEMQSSGFTITDCLRIQYFGTDFLQSEKYYFPYKEVNQLIFISDKNPECYRLIDTYRSTNDLGQVEKRNLITRTYVQISYINVIRENKDLEEFNDFELMNYIFENDFDEDTMKLYEKRKIVRIMKEKIDKFNDNEVLREIALKRELAKKEDRI